MTEVEASERPAEAERPAGGYSVSLPTFEGPLDLLLHLCQKHELDVLDIPIAFVTEKYLEYLAVMQLINLDVASEYLVMAATLAHIKSKMLLPAPPPGQEDDVAADEEDPREALIRRLLEYQKYKAAAEDLQARGVAGRDVFMRGAPIEEAVHTGLPPLAQVPLFSLVEAFQVVLEKSKVKLTHDIVHERVTLADRINELVDILRVKKRVTFEELFDGATTRFDLVITFLALLEMTRLRMTRLFQTDFNSPIYVEFSAQVTASEIDEALGETVADSPESTEDEEEAEEPEPEAQPVLDPGSPEIDDLLAPDDESARALHDDSEGELPVGPADQAIGEPPAVPLAPPEEQKSETDVLLGDLGEAEEDDAAEPDSDEAPISQDVPTLDDGDEPT